MANSVVTASEPVDVKIGEGLYTKSFRSRAILLLMVIYTCNYLDRYIMNILAEPIKNDLNLQDWQLGLMTGLAFALFYAVMGIPIARYAEHADRPKLIAVAITIWSGATAITGAVQNFTQMVLARVVVGVGEAGCTPPAHSLISDYVPQEKRASALATYSLGIPLGSLLGLVIGGFMVDYFGWRQAFLLVGLPGLILALLALLVLREPRREKSVELAAKASIEPLFQALGKMLSIPTYRWAALAASTVCIPGYAIAAFKTSFFLRNHGAQLEALANSAGMGPLTLLGLLMGVAAGATGLIGTYLGGVLADNWKKKGEVRAVLYVPALGCLIAAPFFLMSFVVADLIVSFIFLSLGGLFLSCWYGPLYAAAHSVVPKSSRATATAVILMLLSLIGLTAGPLIVGVLSDMFNYTFGQGSAGGLRWSLIVINLITVLGALMFWNASRFLKHDMLG